MQIESNKIKKDFSNVNNTANSSSKLEEQGYLFDDTNEDSVQNLTLKFENKSVSVNANLKSPDELCKALSIQLERIGATNINTKGNKIEFKLEGSDISIQACADCSVKIKNLNNKSAVSDNSDNYKAKQSKYPKFDETVQLLMCVYYELYGECKYKVDEDNLTLKITTATQEFIVHIDEGGNCLFTEFISDDSYSLSEGTYGATKDEAVLKIEELLKSNGAISVELINGDVVAVFEGEQQVYKVNNDGKITRHKTLYSPKDFIPTKSANNGKKQAITPAEQYINTYKNVKQNDAKYEIIDKNTAILQDSAGNPLYLIQVSDSCNDVKCTPFDEVEKSNDNENITKNPLF